MKRRTIDLASLAQEHRIEIAGMTDGIHCGLDAALWTTAMRPTTRGGKCPVSGGDDEPTSSA